MKSDVKIEIPSVLWIVLFVALVPALSEWFGTWIAPPWNTLVVIILGALARTAQVMWPELFPPVPVVKETIDVPEVRSMSDMTMATTVPPAVKQESKALKILIG